VTALSDEGLIGPSAFPIPDTLTHLLDSAAAELKADGPGLTDTAGDTTGAWAGLDGIYSAPESASPSNVLNPLTGDADEVSSARPGRRARARARRLRASRPPARQPVHRQEARQKRPCCPNCTSLIPEVRNPTAGRRTEEAQGMESDIEYDD
jgi:hypothetical protein